MFMRLLAVSGGNTSTVTWTQHQGFITQHVDIRSLQQLRQKIQSKRKERIFLKIGNYLNVTSVCKFDRILTKIEKDLINTHGITNTKSTITWEKMCEWLNSWKFILELVRQAYLKR
jgi:hypothetical protein